MLVELVGQRDPAIILGDEPTGNLDSRNSARVVEMFKTLGAQQNRAVVCVTHDLAIAAIADVCISMLDGRISSIETNR
jgi:lipoprotein-releasing system ATP-binding protein